jgi:phosphatidylglycerophosphatase A
MSLKIFYDPALDDEGTIIGIQLTIQNKDKYLSVEDLQDNKFYYYDETIGEEAILDMTKQENLNKINDLIKKVLE